MRPRDSSKRLEFRILGPLQVLVEGEERPIAGEKLQALLARLLLEPNRPVPAEHLVDALWDDDPPATARQTVHAHVARLRRVLSTDARSPLDNDGRGYVLHIDKEQLDATRFRTLVAAAREERQAGRLNAARERYQDALALFRGPVLDGVPLERADAERSELEGLRLAALEERIDLDLALGRASELVPELERLAQTEPLRERAWAQLMLALYATGRQRDALAAYHAARRELGAFGLEPGPALRELQRAILNQDPSLVTAPARTAVLRSRRLGRPHLFAATLALAAAAVVVFAVIAAGDDPPRAARAPAPPTAPNTLIQIDPTTNRVVGATHIGRGPDSIAVTDDAVWVANVEDRTVARVDLATKRVRIVGGAPVAHQVVSALNGDVWLSSFEEPVVTLVARQGELPDGVHALAAGPRRVELPGSAEGLAVGGGYLWVTSPSDSGGSDAVFRVDLRTRRVVSAVPVGKLPLFVAFGYGSAWVSNYGAGSVSVIRPGSKAAETIPLPGGPLGIAAGASSIWVVTYWSKQLVRIDAETRRIVRRIPVGSGPLAVAVGAGAVWVTNRDDKTISRIDPATNKVTRTIRLAAAPYGIRVAHRRVWVTLQRCGSMPCG